MTIQVLLHKDPDQEFGVSIFEWNQPIKHLSDLTAVDRRYVSEYITDDQDEGDLIILAGQLCIVANVDKITADQFWAAGTALRFGTYDFSGTYVLVL